MRWLGALCALLFLVHGTAYAQLAERHSFNVRGDVEMIGNALLTCTSCDQSNSALSNGSTVPMRYVNVEGDLLPAGVPQNSSTATLSLPPGATVLSAGLYWGGRAPESNADRGTIHFRTPRGVYRPMVAAAPNLHTFPSQGDPGSRPYTAYVDVTDLVAAAGAGTYAAGGLTSDITQNGGSLGNYGGWALIVLYEHADKPYRRLMVFDGNAGYVNGSNPQSVTVSGLLTPVSGSFDAYMGALVWEGDGGISGDQFSLTGADVLNPGALSDALSPLNNFWNSGITRLGERFTDKNPDYVNQFAVDLKLVDISNTPTNAGRPRLRNGASGATLTFTSSQDAYFPHALVFVTDIFFPDLVTSLRKEARRVDGTPLGPDSTIRHGEEIEYVISFTNSGQDGATQVTVLDPIPANTTYVPNSLHIVSNAQDGFVGEPSDAVGDDVAEYDPAANRVVFRVGTGADAVQGGRLGQGESASMTFRVSVNADAAIGTPIRNDASVRHNAETVPLDYDVEGGAETNVVGPVLPVAEDIDFCPADGSVFNVVNGVGIYRYTPGAGADVRVGSLDFPVSGDLNALMVDASGPRNRLLFHAAGTGMVWAYDPTHPTSPGWYETGAVVNVNLPRAGMTPDGVGYMITSVTGPTDAPTAQMYRIERSGDYGYVVGAPTTLRYDVNPTDRGSGDIAFDDKGYGWLVAGSDLYRIDVDAGTATRQQSFTGAPSGANYAGAAFGDDGRLYVVVNATGAYYAMDLASGTMELVATSVGTGANNRGRDLASCSFPTIEPARLQVEKALASITRAGAAVPATEPAAPGDVLVYDIHVRHVGGNQAATVFPGDVTETVPANTSRTGATADDFACTGTDCTNAEARNIASGQSATFRFSVRIDTDVPASVDRIDNSVSVAGVDCDAAGNDCTETTPLDVRPGLSSIKTLVAVDGAAPTGPVALGDVLTYSVVATNTGNVVLPTVVVADARIVPGSETCAALAPGAECVLTGTYTVTQADIDAGVVTNTATITTPDTPQMCPAGATDAACRPSLDVSTEAAAPALTVVKTAGSPSGDTAGSTVGYQFVVTNTGNVTLSGIAIDDDRLDAPATCAATTLVPSGTTTCIGTHTITQAEIDAGEVRNTATATGTTPGGGTIASPPDDADVGIDAVPALSLVKTAGTPSGGTAGSTVGYQFVVTNTGNVTLSGIAIDDDRLDAPATCAATTLAPGGTTTCTGTHTITQAEIDAGEVRNTATATGTAPGGGTVASPPDDADVGIAAAPALSLVKTAGTPSGNRAGSTVGYQFVVTNTGNVTLSGIAIDDDRLDAPATCAATTLAPGGTTTCTGTHTITQAEIDAGEVRNTATATGTAPGGGTVASPPDDADVAIARNPALATDKALTANADEDASGTVTLHDTLTYTVTATNTGTVTLANVEVRDDRIAPSSIVCASLAPGAACTLVGTYVVAQADVNAGQVLNTASIATDEPGVCAAGDTSAACNPSLTVAVVPYEIVATDDAFGPVNGADGAADVGNLLDNDTLDGVAATPATVSITIDTLPAGAPGIDVDTATGVVSVAPGTPAGTYTFAYTLCEVLNPTNCDTATVTVVVEAAAIVANDDAFGPVNGADGATGIGNLLDNDTLNGVTAVPGMVSIAPDALPAGIEVDAATGAVSVAPGTPAGTYTFAYTLCEVLNPTNCDTATVTVVVEAAAIAADDDAFGPVNGTAGEANAGNLLDNDTLNGVAAAPGVVSIVPDALPAGIAVDAATGMVSVAPGTPAGTYTFAYTLCEVLNPTNCDTATATVVVEAAAIAANDDAFGPVNGTAGEANAGNLLDNDTLDGMPVVPGAVTIAVDPLPAGVAVDAATGVVSVAPGTPAGTYTFAYTLCEVLNPTNCDTATATVVVEAAAIAASDDSASTPQNTPVTTPVLDNDTLDGLPPAVDAVDVTVLVQPANGTVVVGDDGTVTYTPDPGFSGEDVYQYQVCETLNPGNCASATVTVTVLPNRVEAIDDTPGSVGPGEPLDVVVVGNDTSTGAPLDPHSVRVSTPPANGQATCTAGTCTYTPRPGFVGIDTFVYEVCDTSWPVAVCDTATVTIDVEGAATLRLTKTAGVREVRVGDLVRYTLTVENVGEADVTGASLLDTPPAGFSYVGGSLVAEDGRAYATSGYNPIRIDGLSLAVGERTTLHYLLRVGAGVRSGTHVNQVEAFDAAGTSLSNVATAQVRSAVDPLLDESLVVGTVFHDRDGDGWQDSAALSGVHVRGGFAPGAYVAGSTTLDRGDGHQPVADASAPLLHGIALGRIAGRGSEADRSGGNRVVIRQRLREPAFTDDFVLTSSQGITLRMAADGTTKVETSGEAARGLTAAEPVVERRVSAVADGYVVDYVIDNRGIDERGIPGVRIATVEGLLVETDQYGRYHLTGLSGGVRANGRNLILKVDPSTLPPGTVFTTDNPQLRRVTPGLPVRFDFGVQMPATALEGGTERIELELGEVLFAPGSAVLEPRYLPVVEAMAARIDAHAGGDVLIRADGESEALAFERAAALRDALRAAVDPAHADALTVALRAETDDPQTLVALLGEGGTLLGTVLFETDSAEIHPEFGPLLDRLAAFLERRGGGTVTIAGHTDVRGSHAYNAALGLRRAQAVFAALEQRLSPGLRAAVRVEASAGPAAAIGTTREQGERAP